MLKRSLLILLVCLLPLTAWSTDWSAYHAGKDLIIKGPAGAQVQLLDAEERTIKRGTVGANGVLKFSSEFADPMLRIVVLNGKRRALSALFPPVELLAVLPTKASGGLPLIPHVQVLQRGTKKAASGVEIDVSLACGKDKKTRRLGTLRSGKDGVGVAAGPQAALPVKPQRGCRLVVRAAGARLERSLVIEQGVRVTVSADRPIYKPGDTVYLRGVVVDAANGKPQKKTSVVLQLESGSGSVIKRKALKTSGFGVAFTQVEIPKSFSQPRAVAKIKVGTTEAKIEFKVGRYVAPKVEAQMKLDQTTVLPGKQVSGAVVVSRLDGGPVDGSRLEVTASGPDGALLWRKKIPVMDARPVAFSGLVPTGVTSIEFVARVQTMGGDSGSASAHIEVDDGRLRVWAVPESGKLVAGVENGVWIVTQRPGGHPAQATVTLTGRGGAPVEIRTDSEGLGFARITPKSGGAPVKVVAVSGSRRGKTEIHNGGRDTLLQLDRSVARGGETLRATLRTTARTGVAMLDVVQGESAVSSHSAEIKDGKARFDVPLPKNGAGTVRLHGWSLNAAGVVSGDVRLVFVHDQRDLAIELTPDRETYAPRAQAHIDIQVRDQAGRPVKTALGLTAVDKGLVALGLADPRLERAILRLGDSWKKKAADAPDWTHTALFQTAQWRRLAVMASAVEARIRLPRPTETLNSRLAAAQSAFFRAVQKRADRIADGMDAYYKAKRNRRDKKVTLKRLVELDYVKSKTIVDPWGRPLKLTWQLDACADRIAVSSTGADAKGGTGDDMKSSASIENYRKRKPKCSFNIAFGAGGLGMRGVGSGGGGGSSHYGRISAMMISEVASFREDFRDTLEVVGELVTDDQGRARWTVDLADSLTTWLVEARGMSAQGGLGAARTELRVEQPFSVDVSVPPALTRNDVIDLPVAVTNRKKTSQRVSLRASGSGALEGELVRELIVPAQGTSVALLRVAARSVGQGTLEIVAQGDGVQDAVRRKLTVEPEGVPVSVTRTGTLDTSAPVMASIAVPGGGIPGTRDVSLRLYPSEVGAVVEGLDSLLRMPSGCFEQTSATTYPNALVLEYFEQSQTGSPEVAGRARAFLETGWKRLISYEVKGGGFSWFGDAPANKVLTAFGLMEFERIGALIPIDKKVAPRTREWLLSERNKDGSWSPDESYLHADTWAAIQNANLPVTAYITWALARSGASEKELAPSLKYIRKHQDEAGDPYVLSMVALALTKADANHASAAKARDVLLAQMQRVEAGNVWKPQVRTHSFSRGDSSAVETTAMAALAFMDSPQLIEGQGAIDWLMSVRRPGGGWSTTQSTVLSLEALLTAELRRTDATQGTVQVDPDRSVRKELAVSKADFDVVRHVALAADSGERRIGLSLKGEGSLRWQLAATRNVPVAEAPVVKAPLSLDVSPDKTRLAVGQRTVVSVTLKAGDELVRMPTVSIGLPAGFEVDDRLLKKTPGLAKHETIGRQLVLYLTKLEKQTEFSAQFEVIALRSGTLHAGVAKAWPYYEPELTRYVVAPTFTVSAAE